MATGKPAGICFAQIDLDSTKLEQGLKRTHDALISGSIKVEDSYKSLGIKSDQVYNMMRANATAAVDFIKNKTLSSKEEIIRAEQAAADKIARINEQQFGAHASLIDQIKKNYIAMAAAAAAVYAAVIKPIEAYMASETAMLKMGMAMKNQGDFTRAGLAGMEEFSKQIQRTTAYEDDATLAVMANLKSFGLSNEQVKLATKAALDLATAKANEGMTVERASEILGKSYLGISTGLKKLGIQVDETASKSELFNSVMMQIENRFGGSAQAELLTYAGQWKQLKNQWQDVQEFLGLTFLKTIEAVQFSFGMAGAGFWIMTEKILSGLGWLTQNLEAFAKWAGLTKVSEGLGVVTEALKAGATNAQGAANAAIANASANYENMVSFNKVSTAIDAMGKAGQRTQAIDEEAAKAAKKALQEREAAEKAMIEIIRKAQIEIDSARQSQYTKDMIRIDSDIEKYRKLGVNETLITQFAESEKTIAKEKARLKWIELNKLNLNDLEDTLVQETLMHQKSADKTKAIWDATYGYDKKKLAEYMANHTQGMETRMREIEALGDYGNVSEANNARIAAYWVMERERKERDFYSTIRGYENEYRRNVFDWIDKEEKRRANMYKDEIAAAKWARDEKIKFDSNVTQNNLKNIQQGFRAFADTFEDLSSLYAEDSRQRKTLHDISMAFNVAEKAALAAQAVEAAVVAIATQGSGDPYSAFFRIAAMAAAMASLLASAGIAFKGGGGGGGSTTATAATPTLPASTVLGAVAGTGSESISKAYELLGKWHDLEYKELWGIHSEMKALNANISGLVTSIVRTGGVSAIPISTESTMGAIQSQWEQTVKAHYFEGYEKLGDPIIIGLTKALNNWISGAIGKIFGGGIERTLASTGIATTAAAIKDLLAGGGIGAQAYARVAEEHKGGWFGKDWMSSYTVYADLDKNVSAMLDKVFKNLGSTLVSLAEGLGTDTQAAYDYIFEATEINLQGMNAEEVNKTLSEYFSKIGDLAVETLFGDMLMGYQEINEGLLETATRLLIDKVVILDILDMTNQAFTGTTSQAIEFSEALIDIAGDFEKLQEAAQTYYEAFFSEAEKQERLETQLMGAMEGLNLTLPSTRAGYRALVEGLDLTTTAGMEAYVALLDMAGAADKYYSTLEDARRMPPAPAIICQQALDLLLIRWKPRWPGFRRHGEGRLSLRASMTLGGLTSGISIAGESGPEWIVPTYEPQRSSFLRDVGADPEAIGKSIAKHLGNSGRVINFTCTVNGTDKSSEQIVREIVRPLRSELRWLEAIGA